MSQSPNCWYCGRDTMEPVADAVHPYSKCTACGATKVDPLTPSASTCTERTDRKTQERILTPRVRRQKKASCTPEPEVKGGANP